MPSHNELISICIKKKGKNRVVHGDIRSLAAQFGILETIREVADNIFVNFSKITDINACMEEFRSFGFTVEESKRNKPQAEPKPSQVTAKESDPATAQVPGLSNFRTTKSVSFSYFMGIHQHFHVLSLPEKRILCSLSKKHGVGVSKMYGLLLFLGMPAKRLAQSQIYLFSDTVSSFSS